MDNLNKYIDEIKANLNSLLTNESSKETIDKIANTSKVLDTVADLYNNQTEELTNMKTDYISLVKNIGLKTDKVESDIQPEPISFESFSNEWLAKDKNSKETLLWEN